MELARVGRLGVWCWLDGLAAEQAADFARRVEELGYGALWLPEAVGRDPFALAVFLAAHTTRLHFATGIANLYARDVMAMNALRRSVGELTGGRFLLGIGVSHAPLVGGLRKHEYGRPVETMRAYLEGMEGKPYVAPQPPAEVPILLAALRPKMLELAREKAQGAHPYLVPPEHTARAREILGRGPWLMPEQKVLLESEPSRARAAARRHIAVYLGLPNYLNNLRWLGFDDADFAAGGSDRLVDALVVWGDEKQIAQRVQAHWDAGADHVCIQPCRPDGERGPDLRVLEALAPALQPSSALSRL